MRTTIDAAGRVVVPKAMRRALGIDGPAEVEIEMGYGAVEIHPVRVEASWAVADDGRPVLRAPAGTPPLTDEDVRVVLDDVRQWPRS